MKPSATLAKPTTRKSLSKQTVGMQELSTNTTRNLAMQAVGQSSPKQKSVLADQFEESLYMNANKPKQEKSKLVVAMNTIAVIVFIFASAVSVQTLLTNRQTQDVLADKAEQVQTNDAQGVSEGTGRDPA